MSSTIVSRILYTLALSVGSAAAADTFTPFDYPSATTTQPFGLNADGAVVGSFVDSAGATHGFLLREGHFTSIDYPGAVYTSALGINSQGDIVGCHIEDATRIPGTIGCHGYLLHQGTFTSIDVPGKFGAIAAHINDAGQIVGCAHDDDGPGGTMMNDMHGFMYSNGNYSQLSAMATMNYSVTPDGGVTLGVVTMNGTHGYLASGDAIVPFDFPFATLTNPFDIGPAGDVIVGAYIDAAKGTHGFLMRMGDSTGTLGVTGPFEFFTIDYPGSTRTVARGINPQGDIVGYYNDAAGKTHGFFMSAGRHRQD